MSNYKPWMPLMQQVLDSSIWDEPCYVRVVWVTLLLMGNEPGRRGTVDVPLRTIAMRANVTTEEATKAIERLCTADKRSRTPDKEGKRLELLDKHRDWGWKIVNWERHEAERQRVFNAERQLRHRLRSQSNACVTDRSRPVTKNNDVYEKEKDSIGEGNDMKLDENKKEESHLNSALWKASIPKAFHDIANIYNTLTVGVLPPCNELTKSRVDNLRKRFNEHPKREWWIAVFEKLVKAQMCVGKSKSGWKADFDWIISSDTNAVRVMEGRYDTVKQESPWG